MFRWTACRFGPSIRIFWKWTQRDLPRLKQHCHDWQGTWLPSIPHYYLATKGRTKAQKEILLDVLLTFSSSFRPSQSLLWGNADWKGRIKPTQKYKLEYYPSNSLQQLQTLFPKPPSFCLPVYNAKFKGWLITIMGYKPLLWAWNNKDNSYGLFLQSVFN